MTPSLAIQAPASTIRVDPKRGGAARFNVSSTSDRPLKGRLTVKALEGVDPTWLQIEGDSTRDFAGPGPQAVVVRIKVPPDVKTGSYSFRLDGHSVANPDDDFVEGPTVSFTVESEPIVPWWKRWWAIAAMAAVALLVIGAFVWAVLPSKVVVPQDLVGKTYDDARRQVEALGLVAQREDVVDNAKPEHSVLGVDPEKGALEKGATVKLKVAQHKVVPPPPPPLPAVPQIAGQWDSSIGFKYTMQQDGNTFTWRVTSPIAETARGSIDANGALVARWSSPRGTGGGRGRVALSDDRKVAQVIQWENGVVMWRASGRVIRPDVLLHLERINPQLRSRAVTEAGRN